MSLWDNFLNALDNFARGVSNAFDEAVEYFQEITRQIQDYIVDELIKDYIPEGMSEEELRKRLQFVVLGFRGCGKTTLLMRLSNNISDSYVSPGATIGKDAIDFDYVAVGGTRISNQQFPDYGGDPKYWDFWKTGLIQDKPRGLIFMVDHEHPEKHIEALDYIIKILRDNPSVKAELKKFMLLINKRDLWERDPSLNYQTLLDIYRTKLDEINELGIALNHRGVSALEGDRVEEAMRDFFKTLIV